MDRKTYDTGWDDCIDYLRDKRTLQQHQSGFGILFILFGCILVALVIAALFTMWIAGENVYNYMPVLWLAGGGSLLIAAGYFIDKKDRVRYKQREDEFYRKWVQRWKDLGLEGDD